MAIQSKGSAHSNLRECAPAAQRRVTVIIPHYQDLVGLGRCLEALDRQSYDKACFDIIVADNGSPVGAAAVAEVIDQRATLIVVTERGAGPARNGAAALAQGEVLAFIDSDCVAEPQWLVEGVAALAGHDFVGGRVRVLVDDPAHMTPVESFERVFAFDFKTYIQKKGFTGSGNLFCPRRIFETVGGFRVGVSEDVEWSRRAQAMGYSLGYAPGAVVGHPARHSWAELINKWRRVNAETYGLLTERSGGRWRWLLRGLAMPASAIVHTPKVIVSPELRTVGQRLAALVILYRIRLWRAADCLRLMMAG